MVRLLFLISLAAFTTPSLADDWRASCESVASMAEQIMKGRQAGVPMTKMMNAASGELLESLVIEAYDSPRFNGEEYQTRTVADFRDQAYLNCVKARRTK